MDTVTDPLPTSNATNRAIENAAIAFVLAYEATHGRPSRDTRGTGAAADVAGDVRTIEIKAYGGCARGQDLWLETRQVDEARTNPNFWLYIVDNVRQGDPIRFGLLTIGGSDLATLLERAVERRYYTVPFSVATYDRLLGDRDTP
jgi:hypothetical protein